MGINVIIIMLDNLKSFNSIMDKKIKKSNNCRQPLWNYVNLRPILAIIFK